MNTPPLDPELLRRLRAHRLREMERLTRERVEAPSRSEPEQALASATRIHDDPATVMARIDAAEQAMRSVLQAWEADPARLGAHLLPPGDAPIASARRATLPAALDPIPAPDDLPDTEPSHAPSPDPSPR